MKGSARAVSKWLMKHHKISLSSETIRILALEGEIPSERIEAKSPRINLIVDGQDILGLIRDGKMKPVTILQRTEHKRRGRKEIQI